MFSGCLFGLQQLTAEGSTLAAADTSQCQPLPAAQPAASATPDPSSTASASPTASVSPTASGAATELCVSVQDSSTAVEVGQPASFTVQVWVQNGAAAQVTVALAAAPDGMQAAFTGSCPSGNGTTTCQLGTLDTASATSQYQLQAQIPVPSGSDSVTSVTLTATGGATTTPALTTVPIAANTVTVTPAPASPSPSASASSSASPSASASASSSAPQPSAAAQPPPTAPQTAAGTTEPVPPPLGPPLFPTSSLTGGINTSLVSAGNAGSLFPVITASGAVANWTTATPGADPAGSGSGSADAFTVSNGIPILNAQVLTLVALGLAALLSITRIAIRGRARRPGHDTPKQKD